MAKKTQLDALVDKWEPELRRAFLQAVYQLRDQVQIDALTRMIAAGDVDGAISAVGLDPVAFRPFEKIVAATFEAGGDATTGIMPTTRLGNGLKLVVNFDMHNPQAEAWLRDHSSTLVQQITNDQRDVIRATLSTGMQEGQNPREVALDIAGRIGPSGRREGGLIGLTESQSQWVRAYERELRSKTPGDALTRALRDKRFDAAIRRAHERGEPVGAALRAKMVEAYKNRALRYRAEAISRSEAIEALHTAQDQAFQQAEEKGVIKSGDVDMTWRATPGKRTRHAHRRLNGQTQPRGVPFKSELGPIRYPGDPLASAANTIHCRCWLEPRIKFLKGLR